MKSTFLKALERMKKVRNPEQNQREKHKRNKTERLSEWSQRVFTEENDVVSRRLTNNGYINNMMSFPANPIQ